MEQAMDRVKAIYAEELKNIDEKLTNFGLLKEEMNVNELVLSQLKHSKDFSNEYDELGVKYEENERQIEEYTLERRKVCAKQEKLHNVIETSLVQKGIK